MFKVKVNIEEHSVKTIVVECPDEMTDVDERTEYAREKVVTDYKAGKIVLNADDYSGITLCEVEDEEEQYYTGWNEI